MNITHELSEELARFEAALPEILGNRAIAHEAKSELDAEAKQHLRAGRLLKAARAKLDAQAIGRAVRDLDNALAKVSRTIDSLKRQELLP